jgi:hypothetical protein
MIATFTAQGDVLTAHTDLTGHWGADGKLYLLDFSRVYPPEDILHVRRYFPSVPSRGLFYRMLRPGTATLSCLSKRPAASLQTRKAHILTRLPMAELVGSYSVPLCSDACSRWIADDKNAHAHNLEVRTIRFSVFLALSTNPAVERAVGSHHSGIDCQVADATRWLLDKVVPDLALELAFRCIKIKPDEVRTYNQGPCSIALRRGNNETGSSRCVPGCSFPSPESKGLAWAYFTSICTTFFIACTPAASTCGACGHARTHTHTAPHAPPPISSVRFPLRVALIRYLGLLRSKFIETARNYLVDGSTMESGSGSSSVGAVYSNIIFTEVPLHFTTSRSCSLRHLL